MMKNSFGREKIRMCARKFTLIELLIVVTIIALLAAMLLPALNKARTRAKEIRCINNMKQFSPALSLYCSDNEDILPFHGEWVRSEWRERIHPYVKNGAAPDNTHNPIFTCPEWEITCTLMGHSKAEHWIKNCYYCNNAQLAELKVTRVKRASEDGMIFDASFKDGNGAATRPDYIRVGWRHVNKNANFLFVDGHVVTIQHTGNSNHIIDIFDL